MKSRNFKCQLGIVFFALMTACTRTSNPSAHSTSSGAGGGGGSMEGTYAGGGGNGLNGSAIESYQQDVSTRPEFKMYIVPVLERMAQTTPDVFVGYLNWVIHHKAWYFVPVALPNLPKDKTALAFPSDQLALHSESEIYIDAKAYSMKSHKEQAYLILHEMVMGARLLMKHSPRVQCLALDADKDSSSCDSADVLKLAVAPPVAPDDKPVLTASDDEAVRSMTVFLLARGQDYSGANVRNFRISLDFNYPWDRVVSNVTLDTLEDAIRTVDDREDKFLVHSETGAPTQKCDIGDLGRSEEKLVVSVVISNVNAQHLMVGDSPIYMFTLDSLATASGVLNPFGGTDVVDLLHAEPDAAQLSGIEAYTYDYFLTREPVPRLIRFDITHVREITRADHTHVFIPIRSSPVVSCRVETL